jgi:hypothetical protein
MKSEFLSFRLIDLGKVKDYVAKMRELSSTDVFQMADIVLVERQMRSCMKTMAVSLRAFNYEKTVMVAPQSIKRHFKTSMKKHSKNKKAGIEVARKYLSAGKLEEFNRLRKKDDIADCILQTIWYLRNGVPIHPRDSSVTCTK